MWVGGWVRECQLAIYGSKQGIQKYSEYWGKRDHKEFGEYLKNKEEKEILGKKGIQGILRKKKEWVSRIYREYLECREYMEAMEYRETREYLECREYREPLEYWETRQYSKQRIQGNLGDTEIKGKKGNFGIEGVEHVGIFGKKEVQGIDGILKKGQKDFKRF